MDTNETTLIDAAGPEDLIATVWYNLGYKPTRSLVVVGLEGPRRRVGVILRTDLPPLDDPGDWLPDDGPGELLDSRAGALPGGPPDGPRGLLAALAATCLVTVARSGAEAVLAIAADELALGPAVRPLVTAVEQEVAGFGLQLIDVLGVTSTAFGSLLCPDPRCCPPEGRPIAQVLSSRGAVAHVVNGLTVAETENDLLLDVDAVPTPSARPALAPSGQVLADRGPGPRLSLLERWQWWHHWSHACAVTAGSRAGRSRGGSGPGRQGTDDAAAGFSAALHDPLLRDAVLMHLIAATPQEVRAMLDGTHGRTSAAGPLAPDLDGLLRRRPDTDRLDTARTVLAGAARVARPGDRGPALAVLAMLAWFEGRGGHARLLAERARADSPAVTLIGLVDDLLLRRVPPPWRWAGPKGGSGNGRRNRADRGSSG